MIAWCNAAEMKLIAFWLLVVLAVLVPATAVVASVTISAPAAGDARRVAVESKGMAKHGAYALHAKVDKAAKATAVPRVKAEQAVNQPADHCCDLTPCSHCAGCGSCASIAARAGVAMAPVPFTSSHLPESVERAEFLLAGQERPPRAS